MVDGHPATGSPQIRALITTMSIDKNDKMQKNIPVKEAIERGTVE